MEAGPWRVPQQGSELGLGPGPGPELEPEPEPASAESTSEEEEEWSDEGVSEGSEGEEEEGEWEEEDDAPLFLVNAKVGGGAEGGGGSTGGAEAEEGPRLWQPSHVRPSLFSDGPSVCVFGLALEEHVPEGLVPWDSDDPAARLSFKITQVGYRAVRDAFKSGGMTGLARGSEWNALWGKIKLGQYRKLRYYQRVNHWPGTWQLGRKDNLSRNCARQRRRVGAAASCRHPLVYHLPEDRMHLERDMQRMQEPIFIVKPRASSRGRGIRLITQSAQIPRGSKSLVQQYIANPLLVDGYKLDIRVYVVVTSWDPLRAYINEDGLVRFAVQKYKAGAKYYKRKGAHITNYSVNKNHKAYVESDSDSQGSKWSIEAFRRWLRERLLVDDEAVWAEIKDQCIRTLLACEGRVFQMCKQHGGDGKCYELWGFDLLLDEHLKAWVIEVNTSPSLNSASPLDSRIKGQLLVDLLNLVGIVPVNRACRPPPHASASEVWKAAGAGAAMEAMALEAPAVAGSAARNARRRAVVAMGVKRGGAELSAKDADYLVGSLTPEERLMLQIGEDEFARAAGGAAAASSPAAAAAEPSRRRLRLAYPGAGSARYLSLYETPRYFATVQQAWMQSKVRRKYGAVALALPTTSPAAKVATTSAGRRATGRQQQLPSSAYSHRLTPSAVSMRRHPGRQARGGRGGGGQQDGSRTVASAHGRRRPPLLSDGASLLPAKVGPGGGGGGLRARGSTAPAATAGGRRSPHAGGVSSTRTPPLRGAGQQQQEPAWRRDRRPASTSGNSQAEKKTATTLARPAPELQRQRGRKSDQLTIGSLHSEAYD